MKNNNKTLLVAALICNIAAALTYFAKWISLYFMKASVWNIAEIVGEFGKYIDGSGYQLFSALIYGGAILAIGLLAFDSFRIASPLISDMQSAAYAKRSGIGALATIIYVATFCILVLRSGEGELDGASLDGSVRIGCRIRLGRLESTETDPSPRSGWQRFAVSVIPSGVRDLYDFFAACASSDWNLSGGILSLSHAEIGEHPIDHRLGGVFAGDLAELFQGLLQIDGGGIQRQAGFDGGYGGLQAFGGGAGQRQVALRGELAALGVRHGDPAGQLARQLGDTQAGLRGDLEHGGGGEGGDVRRGHGGSEVALVEAYDGPIVRILQQRRVLLGEGLGGVQHDERHVCALGGPAGTIHADALDGVRRVPLPGGIRQLRQHAAQDDPLGERIPCGAGDIRHDGPLLV